MEDSIWFRIGQGLGFLWVFAWLPYAGWKAASTFREGIFPPKKAPPQKDPIPRKDKRPKHTPPVPKPKKEAKSKYSVLDSYDDEHKITNPVEFRT